MTEDIVAGLPLPQRLALSYAPSRSRRPFLALLALDARLAGIVRQASEPMLAQMRLAWWRETLTAERGRRPAGEPLLELLESWAGEEQALTGLVDGWELLLAEPPMAAALIAKFGEARAAPFAALARLNGVAESDMAARAGLIWALADLANGLSHAGERDAALALAREIAQPLPRLPRSLRPLAVLAGLARRSLARGGRPLLHGPASGALALRLGILGR